MPLVLADTITALLAQGVAQSDIDVEIKRQIAITAQAASVGKLPANPFNTQMVVDFEKAINALTPDTTIVPFDVATKLLAAIRLHDFGGTWTYLALAAAALIRGTGAWDAEKKAIADAAAKAAALAAQGS